MRALSFGLIPERDDGMPRPRVSSSSSAPRTRICAPASSPPADLLPVLSDAGYADVAYELLFQRTAPSWLNMIDRGATTIWEDWEGIDEFGAAHESLNHYSKGAVIRFLHTHTLGLRQAPGSVAWESVVIQPVPGPSLTWARGSHETPQGTIRVEWRIEDGEIHISAELPAATSARIVFPDGTARRRRTRARSADAAACRIRRPPSQPAT